MSASASGKSIGYESAKYSKLLRFRALKPELQSVIRCDAIFEVSQEKKCIPIFLTKGGFEFPLCRNLEPTEMSNLGWHDWTSRTTPSMLSSSLKAGITTRTLGSGSILGPTGLTIDAMTLLMRRA